MAKPADNSQSTAPRTDDTRAMAPLHGADRAGLGHQGWAEVPEDGIGGHPEIYDEVSPGGGAINGPKPPLSSRTGAAESAGMKPRHLDREDINADLDDDLPPYAAVEQLGDEDDLLSDEESEIENDATYGGAGKRKS